MQGKYFILIPKNICKRLKERNVFGLCLTYGVLSSSFKVRTKDRIFDSISHLINHHLENNLPIVSAGSELCLQQPVERKQ